MASLSKALTALEQELWKSGSCTISVYGFLTIRRFTRCLNQLCDELQKDKNNIVEVHQHPTTRIDDNGKLTHGISFDVKLRKIWNLKPLKECILIKDPALAAIYSGTDVWLIPYDIETLEMKIDKAYVGDDWSIINNEIIGYHDEQCFIAVEPNDKLGWK
jgi:hypothetical protein